MLPGDQITHIPKGNPYPEKACQALIRADKEAGSKDNITAIVLNWGNRLLVIRKV